jgi:hypothetical protein
MNSKLFYDPKKINDLEAKPCFLGFLLYSKGLHQDFQAYIDRAEEDLDRLTKENICILFIDAKHEDQNRTYYTIDTESDYASQSKRAKDYSRVEWFRPDTALLPDDPCQGFRQEDRLERTVALGNYFLKGDYWRMPCLVFFSHFRSKEFYVFELSDMKIDEVSNLLLTLSSESRKIWEDVDISQAKSIQKIREQKFIEFEPVLNKKFYSRKFKKFSQNSGILTIVSSVVS